RSGDLEIALPGGQARRISEQEVIDSHHRQQRYLAHPLLALLLTGEEPPLGGSAEAPAPDNNGLVPDRQDLRQFIIARLAVTMGASSEEMAIKYEEYLKHNQLPCDLGTCRAQVEEVARQLHMEGKLNATPHDDGLFLLLK